MSSLKRLTKELRELQETPIEFVSLEVGTPFQSGTFQLEITFPTDYPFRPPKVKLVSTIFHPNFKNGPICTRKLCQGCYCEWSPRLQIRDVLKELIAMLVHPNLNEEVSCTFDTSAKILFLNDRDVFNLTAQEWNQRCKSNNQHTANNIHSMSAEVRRRISQARTARAKKLDLFGLKMGVGGARIVAEEIVTMAHVNELDLRSNDLGPEGARALAPALRGITGMQKLALDYNDLGCEGARAIGPVLRGMTGLHTLGLGGNKLGCEGASTLVEALSGMTCLQKLFLGGEQHSVKEERD
eukprot:c11730_g1_i1.p1 GENE.c11730_g1_i1~~c11730_g1_i1.p1  ORF type:complete len:309 (+),score=53.55 c11730_g1_i1:37-927(+)